MPARELGLDEPAHFFAKAPDGRMHTLSLRVVKEAAPEATPVFQLADTRTEGGHLRSWSKGGMHASWPIKGVGEIRFAVTRLEPAERFRLTSAITAGSR